MSFLFCDPDELESLTPHNPISCPGLEQLTGADFLLSSMPILPTSNCQWHIDNNSIFVNLKRGYDLVVNHDSHKNFAARIQKLGVKPGRAILLGVGDYRNKDDMLWIPSYNKPPSAIPYKVYLQTVVNCLARGLTWITIPSSDYIGDFIASMDKRPTDNIVVYNKGSYQWGEDEWWQQVEEPSNDDIRKILSCGLPEFGPRKAQSLYQYLIDNHLPLNLFNALVILSAVNEKGKRQFEVPMVGKKSHQQLRQILFNLADDEHSIANCHPNLSLDGGDFQQGARAALDQFHLLFQERLKGGMEFKKAYEESINVVKNTIGELIPF